MKTLLFLTIFCLSQVTNAADFTIQLQPANNSVSDPQVSSISNTKVDGLGTLSTKSTITNSEVADGALSSSKISNFVSTVASQISSALSSYLPLSSIPNCSNDQMLSNISGTLTCIQKNKSVHVSSIYLATEDVETIYVNTTAAPRTILLPQASLNVDKKYTFILESGVNPATIDPNGSEQICDKTTIRLIGLKDSVTVQSDGSKWIGLNNSCLRVISGSIGGTDANGNCGASTTCTIIKEIPTGLSLLASANTSGNINVSFMSGMFSEMPVCTCSGVSWGSAFRACFPNAVSSAGVTLVITSANEGNGLVGAAQFSCHGIR